MNKTREELLLQLSELQQKLKVIESDNISDISDNKLWDKNKHYHYLFESNPQPMWFFDIESLRFLEINDAAIHHYGYSKDEFLSMTIKDIRPEEDIEALKKYIEFKHQPYNLAGEWRHLKKNGEIIFVDIISHELAINNRKAIHVMVIDITEQKKAEEKLKKTALLLQSSIESPKDMIILSIDKNYNYLYFNECHRLTMLNAYGQEVKIGMNLLECITSEENSIKSKINYDKALNGESHITIEEYGDIEKMYYETRYNPIFNAKNEIIGTTAFSANITDRKLAEQALKESEEKTRYILKHNPNAIAVFDNQMNLLFVSDRFLKDYDVKDKNIIGKNHYEAFPEIPEKWRNAHKKALQGEVLSNDDDYFIRTDGSITYSRWECRPWYHSDKSIGGMVAYTEVITERKLAEIALKESYALIKIAGEKAKLGGWIVNLDENRCYWTNEVAAIHEVPSGYSPLLEEGIGFYAPEWRDKITEVFTNCVQNGVPYDEEMQILTAKGKRVWVRTIGEAVKDSNGKIIKVQGAFQDITERKISEEALLAKMDELDRFHKLTVGREIAMVTLKKEVNNLLNKLGQENKYKIVE